MRNREMVLTIIHRSNNRPVCVCVLCMCYNEPSPKWETTWNILAAHHRISFSDKLLIAWIRNLILIYGVHVHSMPVWWFQSFRFRFCLGAFRLFVSFNLYFKRSNPIRSDPIQWWRWLWVVSISQMRPIFPISNDMAYGWHFSVYCFTGYCIPRWTQMSF